MTAADSKPCVCRSARKPCCDWAGYVCSRRSGPLLADGKRGWCVILDASKGGDWSGSAEDSRWIAVCNAHGTLVQHTSLKGARATMKSGTHNFCDACRESEAH